MENLWMKNFPLACSSLLTPLEECQKAVDKALDEIQLEFTWLEEVENEAYKMFAVKRNKLEMMPKTPGQKTRGRKKTKRKLSEVDEEKENKNQLSFTKFVPTVLKFEEKSPNTEKSTVDDSASGESLSDNKSGRPKRNCAMTRPVYNDDEGEKPLKGTRQSRRQINKKPEISPSVKERTKAYENLIKGNDTKSPVYTHLHNVLGDNEILTPKTTKKKVSGKNTSIPEVKGMTNASMEKPILNSEKYSKNSVINEQVAIARMESQSKLKDNDKEQSESCVLDETQVVVTEVFELQKDCKSVKLKEFEMVKSKTTPLTEVSLGLKKDNPKTCKLISQESNEKKSLNIPQEKRQIPDMDETQIVLTEVFEINSKNKIAVLKDSEIVKIKTVHIEKIIDCQNSCDKFSKDNEKHSEDVSVKNKNSHNVLQNSDPRSKYQEVKPSSIVAKTVDLNATFTKEEHPTPIRNTRTKIIKNKEQVSTDIQLADNDGPSTRTRTAKKLKEPDSTEEQQTENDGPSTRTRKAKLAAASVVTESVGAEILKHLGCGLKRPVEERGLSPCPKRTRSYQIDKPLEDQTSIIHSPLQTEDKDILKSPRRSPKAFKFNSAQKKISGFTNRTPGFGINTGRFFSFAKNTPQSSFLKRNSQSPMYMQIIQDQKKKKMLEKDARDMERIKRAAEMKKKKIEEMKRQREEKERKIAEIKEKKLREEQEMKERLNKKLVEQSALNEKIMEAKLKEEKEKQKLRLKKQMEADARRKQEEEDRQRKLAEQEKERIKQQEEERKHLAQVEAQKLELKKLINSHNNTIKNNGNSINNPSVSLHNQSVNHDKSLN
ncbi:hypothetical protein Btru_056211, partial [Bulinus truncatus]